MTTDDDLIISAVIAREGGYVNNAADKGGPTKYGITLKTLADYRGVAPDLLVPADVEHLSEMEARAIYRKRYIEEPGFSALVDADLRGILVDCGVLHGPRNAIRMLQRALGAKDDGILGAITLTAANAWDGKKLARRLLAERLKFLGRLISKDLTDKDKDGIPDNTEFASGWLNRLADQWEGLA